MPQRDTLTKLYALIALIVVLIEVGRLGYHGPIGDFLMSNSVFSVFCVIPVVVLLGSKHFKVNRVLMLFCVVSAISLILNRPVINYMSTLRFCFFCGMLCLLSPLIDNTPLRQFRQYLWRFTILMCQFVVVGSLLLFAITSIMGKGDLLLISSHPMMLSAISAFVALVVTWRILSREEKVGKIRLTLDYLLLIASIMLIVWGGARSAMLGFGFAEIYLLVVFRKKLKAVGRVFLIVAAAAAFISIAGGEFTWRIEFKFNKAEENNSIIFSRQQLWESRLEEFCDSPIIGIGFANATRYSTLYDNEKVVVSDPNRVEEPGSSWLSVLSNTGIVGFLILATWNLSLFTTIRQRRKAGDIVASQYGALLTFVIIHGAFEGWILYAGSFIFFIYWLLTARITTSSPTHTSH